MLDKYAQIPSHYFILPFQYCPHELDGGWDSTAGRTGSFLPRCFIPLIVMINGRMIDKLITAQVKANSHKHLSSWAEYIGLWEIDSFQSIRVITLIFSLF